MNVSAAYDFVPDMGSLVSVDHKDRVVSHVEDAKAKGATVLTGGNARPDLGPAFFEPTILEGVTHDMLAGSTETFGPVVGLYRFKTEDEGIALANDTDYGLNASSGARTSIGRSPSRGGSTRATSTSTTSSRRPSPPREHPQVVSSSRASAPVTATRVC